MQRNAIKIIAALAMGLSSTLPVWAAEETSTAERNLPGVAVAAGKTVTATVETINHATRNVVLRYPDDSIEVFVAGDEVRNLDQVEVGDQVKIDYNIGFVAALQPVEDGITRRRERIETGRAEPGQKPAGTVRKTVFARCNVNAVDPETRNVTLKCPLRTVTLPVAEDIDLDEVDVGDMVDAEYIESIAISVQPANAEP